MTTYSLSADDVRAEVSMPAAIDAVRLAFLALEAGEFELPVRTALRDGAFLTMTAHHRPTASLSVKTVSLDFDRRPAVQGTVLWTSLGSPDSLLMDAGAVTALRTGAVVGVATDLLAPADVRSLVLVGLGGQSADQLRAVQAVRDVERVTLVDRSPELVAAFHQRCAAELDGLEVHEETDVAVALAHADVVCCATPSTEPLFTLADLPERVHVNAIGAYRQTMQELPIALLTATTVVVDQVEAVLEESGEIHRAVEEAGLDPAALVELGAALGDPGRRRAARTVFKSVGLGIQDWSVANAVATARGLVGQGG